MSVGQCSAPPQPVVAVAPEERLGRLSLLIGLGLVVLTLVAYSRIWDNDFINLDDTGCITENPEVMHGLTRQGFGWAWTAFYQGSWVPLTWMSLQADASVSAWLQGPRANQQVVAAIFHGQNLLWHCATVVLLFHLLRRLTGALWRSAVVAALFAVHPLHVESVAWASERKDVLSAFFWVLTLLAYLRYVESPGLGRYLLLAAAFVLGLLAKPMLVTLPCVLLLLDWWPLRRFGKWQGAAPWEGAAPAEPHDNGVAGAAPSPPPRPVQRGLAYLLGEKAPLLALALAACVVTFLSQRHSEAVKDLTSHPLTARLANAVESYGWYVAKTFWPSGLAAFYCHPADGWQWGPVLLSAAVLLGITTLALLQARRQPWLLVGWLWFVGTLVPVIGLVQVGDQARADRYVYIPHIGLFLALVWGAADLLQRLRLPAAVQAGLAALALVLVTVATWLQVGHWRDSETLWNHALAVTRDNHVAHASLGACFYQRALLEEGARQFPQAAEDLERARRQLQRAVELSESTPGHRTYLGTVLSNLGRLEEAAEQFREAAEHARNSFQPWVNLGYTLARQGKYTEVISCLERALELNPREDTSHIGLGVCFWHLHRHDDAEREWRLAPNQASALDGFGLVLLRKGLLQDALEKFDAVRGEHELPGCPWSHRGLAQGRLGEWELARQSQAKAIELATPPPYRAEAPEVRKELACYHCRLGQAWHALGQHTEAAQAYAEASRLNPDWPRNDTAEAWQLATASDPGQRDPQTALELAEQVCQASKEPPCEALDALAAALVALGRYEQAAATARQALERAGSEHAPAIQARLGLYEKRRPFVARAEGK